MSSKSPSVMDRGSARARDSRRRHVCLSSMSRPPALAGWRNAMREPCAPCRGSSSINRTPCAFSASHRRVDVRHAHAEWCRPSPRFSRNFATGESARAARRAPASRRPSRRSARDAGRRPPARSVVRPNSRSKSATNAAASLHGDADVIERQPRAGCVPSPRAMTPARGAVGIDLARGDAIEQPLELPGASTRRSTCCMKSLPRISRSRHSARARRARRPRRSSARGNARSSPPAPARPRRSSPPSASRAAASLRQGFGQAGRS